MKFEFLLFVFIIQVSLVSDLLAQAYFNSLSHSNLIHAPSFVGASKKSKVSFCFNRLYDDEPTVSPGMTNFYISFDKLMKNRTVGVGTYLSYDRVRTTKPFENYFLTSTPPEFRLSNFNAGLIVSAKYSLPNLKSSRPKYSFSPSFFCRINGTHLSEVESYVFDVKKVRLDYTQTISGVTTFSLGSGLMVTSKNAFVSIKISGESGFYKNEYRSVVAAFGNSKVSSTKERPVLFSSEQILSAGVTIPKRENALFRLVLSGAIGRLGTSGNQNFTRKINSFENDHRSFLLNGLDYHAVNTLVRYRKVLTGLGQTRYFNYSIFSYLFGLHYERIRVMNSISNQGYSLSVTVLFD